MGVFIAVVDAQMRLRLGQRDRRACRRRNEHQCHDLSSATDVVCLHVRSDDTTLRQGRALRRCAVPTRHTDCRYIRRARSNAFAWLKTHKNVLKQRQ